jgi:transglutaminase-like putative cysteine protease
MLLSIRHETVYRYSHTVDHSVQIVRLTPRPEPGQRTLRWKLSSPGRQIEQLDAFGNVTHLITVDEPLEEIHLLAEGRVDTSDAEGTLPTEETGLSPLAFLAETSLTTPDDRLRDFAARWTSRALADPDGLLEMGRAILDAVVWEPGVTTVEHDAAEALALGRGVCQDHAHLFTAVCRLHRIPARYVSGYFHTGESTVASHAWADAWLGEDRGWFSVDITHGTTAGPRHCRLAVGRDYMDAGPVRGVRRGGGEEALHVAVHVSGRPAPRPKRQKRDFQQQQQQ